MFIVKGADMITINIQKSQKLKNYEYAMFVSFDFNNKILEAVKNSSERYYNPDTREWELPIKKLQYLTETLSDFDFEIKGHYIDFTKKEAKVPNGFEFKTKPFEHQIDGFNYGLQNEKWLLADEQGLGKTKQIIDIAVAKKLEYGYKHCLIICGVNGLKWNWKNEIATHSNETCHILGQKFRKDGRMIIGSNTDKLNDVLALGSTKISANLTIPDYFIVTNVETLRDEKIVAEIVKLTKSGVINMIAFDECHKAKAHTSQQAKGILKLSAETMIAMTGTPIMNKPLDLYTILKWLGYESHAFYSFKNHYCVMGGYGGYEVVGYKNLDELQERLNDIMLRRLKKDVFDLPDKLYIDEYVEMTPKQAIIYKEVTSAIKANIDNIKMQNNPLAELIRMRQATGYTGILSSTVQESAKLDRMEELVEEAIENGKKVVIFSNWTQMTDIIVERLKRYYPSVITGQTKDSERQEEVDAFQTNPACKVIVGTIGAMGTGITLTAGTVEIFMDHPWNRALYDQAVDRCHRIGQSENVTVYNLLCKDTIDERVWNIVKKKGQIADNIVDGIDIENKSEIIDYLLS